MQVEVLSVSGCPNALPAGEAVRRILREERIDADVRVILVDDEAGARRLRFLGSPTIRVNGLDVERASRSRADYGLSCRIYRTASGIGGLPPDEWIRASLAATDA